MIVDSPDKIYNNELNSLLIEKVIEPPAKSLESLHPLEVVIPEWCKDQENSVRRLISNCTIKNRRHLETCQCCNDFYSNIYSKMYNSKIEYIKESEKEFALVNIQNILDTVKNQSYEVLLGIVNDSIVVCPIELSVTLDILERFINKYDFSDPRVYGIVDGLVKMSLDVARLQRESDIDGVVYKQKDKFDNVIYQVSPIVEARRRLNDSIVSSIVNLDKVIDGSKFSHVITESRVFNRDELYPDVSERCLNPPESIIIENKCISKGEDDNPLDGVK